MAVSSKSQWIKCITKVFRIKGASRQRLPLRQIQHDSTRIARASGLGERWETRSTEIFSSAAIRGLAKYRNQEYFIMN
jgi:hypothetical protein